MLLNTQSPIHTQDPSTLAQKTKREKLLPRSQSVPVDLKPGSDIEDGQLITKKNFLELYSLVWTYAQTLQKLMLSKGQNAHTYVKTISFKSMGTRIRHKISAIKFGFGVLKKVFAYLYSEKLFLIFGYLSMFVTSYCGTKLPQIVGQMIDTSVVQHDKAQLISQAQFFVIIALVFSISEFFWSHLFSMLSQRIRWSLKSQIYAALLRREIEYFDKRPLTEVLESVNGLINFVESICTAHFAGIGRNTMQFCYCAYMLGSTSYKLTLVMAVILPFHVIIPQIYNRLSSAIRGHEGMRDVITGKRVMETFQNIKIIKAFSTEDYELDNYDNLLKANTEASMRASKSGCLFMAISGFYNNFTLLAIVYVGMLLVSRGEVSPGSLSSYLLFAMSISSSFNEVTHHYKQIRDKIPACQRLFGIIEETSKIPYRGGKKLEKLQGHIEFHNVNFSYPVAPDVPILKNVSVRIKAGESVAFVGMSGGGKSTIVSLLLRFYDVNEGAVRLDGVDIKDLDLNWLHSQVGYVSQDPILFSGTIEQNITYGLKNYTEEALFKAINMANASFIFNKDLFPNGLQSDIGERGNTLSGGQKQRLAIARALMREPKILILDEATSSLDANAEFDVQTAVDNLISSSQLTVVTIAHRLSTIINCNTIFVLKHGEVVEQGNHKDLVERGGIYRNLVEKQFQSSHHHH